MRFPRIATTVVLGLTVTFAAIGCGQQAAPVASTSPAASKSAAPSTAPSGAASPAAQQSPAASAKAAPTPSTPAASAKPSASASGDVSAADLIAKATNTAEYSFVYKMTGMQATTGKVFIKGARTRMEMTTGGQLGVILADTANQTASMLMPSEKTAIKMDFGQASVQMQRPADRTGTLANDARPVGTETIDGKSAAVFEISDGQQKGKAWIWIERGVPLKMETTGPLGQLLVEYTDYQFGSQPDTLFQIPADYHSMDLPSIIPGVPGAPGGRPGVPGNIPIPGL